MTTFTGTSGNDVLNDGAGNDTMNGLGGHDKLYASEGNDTVDGGTGNDVIEGGVGFDRLTGGAGNDVVRGGADNDIMFERQSSGNDRYYGDEGSDQISVYREGEGAASDILIDGGIDGGWLIFEALTRYIDKVAIIGGDLATHSDQIQVTGGGDVTIDAGKGPDMISLWSVHGRIQITLGGGDDNLHFREHGSATGLVTIADFEPGDRLTLPDGAGPGRLVQQGSDVAVQIDRDWAEGPLPYETRIVIKNALVANLHWSDSLSYYYHSLAPGSATEGNNTLSGNGSANTINGLGGNDLIYGLGGNDTINGGTGIDRMVGGDGDDSYTVDNAGDAVWENSRQGTDTVRTSLAFILSDHVENLVLTGGGHVNATGNALANAIAGNGGNNRLNGRGGADTMSGGPGHDSYVVDHVGDRVIEAGSSGTDTVESSVSFNLPTHVEKLVLTGTSGVDGRGNSAANTITGNAGGNFLNGSSGNDVIDAGAGNDRVLGGAGSDSLKGGTGLDRFEFTTFLGSTNVDKILDYSVANDTIYLLRSVFTKAGANGTLAPAAFRQGTAAADAGDRIVYDQATGKIFYDSDGTGAAAAILFATVTPGTALTNADFMIYG